MSGYGLKLSEAELNRYALMAKAAAATEADLWAAAGVVEGAVVADVGCGPGAMSAVLGRLVGPAGRVIAVDQDPEAVETARATVAGAGLQNVSVRVGDALSTGIEDVSVDVVMIRHVLAHNGPSAGKIVAHAASLVRPGGSVYLVDAEITGLRIRPEDPDLADLSDRYREWHEQRGNDLSIGLRLGELLASAGLDPVDHQGRYQIVTLPPGLRSPPWAAREALVAAGVATALDVERWNAAFERVDRAEPRPTMFAPLFFALGRRSATA
ncbi:MAG: methyltransferase domain-containing protein [Acidimicrobiales bacterium]